MDTGAHPLHELFGRKTLKHEPDYKIGTAYFTHTLREIIGQIFIKIFFMVRCGFVEVLIEILHTPRSHIDNDATVNRMLVAVKYFFLHLHPPNYFPTAEATNRQRELTVTTISCSDGAISVGAGEGADFKEIVSMENLPL